MLRSEGGSINQGKGSHGHCRWQEWPVQKPHGRRESLPLQGPVGLGNWQWWILQSDQTGLISPALRVWESSGRLKQDLWACGCVGSGDKFLPVAAGGRSRQGRGVAALLRGAPPANGLLQLSWPEQMRLAWGWRAPPNPLTATNRALLFLLLASRRQSAMPAQLYQLPKGASRAPVHILL